MNETTGKVSTNVFYKMKVGELFVSTLHEQQGAIKVVLGGKALSFRTVEQLHLDAVEQVGAKIIKFEKVTSVTEDILTKESYEFKQLNERKDEL